MSSSYGHSVRVQVFGQSHSAGIGVAIDGLPAGEPVDLDELRAFLKRRAPGRNAWSTPRSEPDEPRVVCGLNDRGRTCGAPLAVVIENTNTRSKDYSELRRKPRPGHSDMTAMARWHGEQDVAGGGHFSGRLTAPLCVAGGICKQILARRGIAVGGHLAAVAGVRDARFDPVALTVDELLAPGAKEFPVIDDAVAPAMVDAVLAAKEDKDSVGGVVECAVLGMPVGVGSPHFDGLENRIAQAVFGVPAVKGLEFGRGFEAAGLRGSQNNDPYVLDDAGRVRAATNNAGGILGGISTGMPIVFRVAFKPTSSIAAEQATVNLEEEAEQSLEVVGRHDPCVAARAVPVVEAVCALALADALADDGLLGPVSDLDRDPAELERLRRLFGAGFSA